MIIFVVVKEWSLYFLTSLQEISILDFNDADCCLEGETYALAANRSSSILRRSNFFLAQLWL